MDCNNTLRAKKKEKGAFGMFSDQFLSARIMTRASRKNINPDLRTKRMPAKSPCRAHLVMEIILARLRIQSEKFSGLMKFTVLSLQVALMILQNQKKLSVLPEKTGNRASRSQCIHLRRKKAMATTFLIA